MVTRSGGSGRRRPSSNGTTTCPNGRRCSARRAGPSAQWPQRPGERSQRMPFESTVAAFAAALCDPAEQPPAAIRGRRDAPDARRFAVYRNNVAVGLIGALEARYPVARRIFGPEAFRAMARAFAEAHKPRSPVLIAYGAAFPDFIEAQGPNPDLRRLADVARLENAWVEAYHAEDAPAAGLADLAVLSAEALPNARVALHPAARLLSLATPAASIW